MIEFLRHQMAWNEMQKRNEKNAKINQNLEKIEDGRNLLRLN